jgi:hypothetical protein
MLCDLGRAHAYIPHDMAPYRTILCPADAEEGVMADRLTVALSARGDRLHGVSSCPCLSHVRHLFFLAADSLTAASAGSYSPLLLSFLLFILWTYSKHARSLIRLFRLIAPSSPSDLILPITPSATADPPPYRLLISVPQSRPSSML